MIAGRWRILSALILASLVSVVATMPVVAAEDETAQGFETVLRGTNDYRIANGTERLVHDPRLSAVAQAWAERMASDFAGSGNMDSAFRHNPDMSSQVPTGWQAVGENIAVNGGYSQPYDRLLAQWRESPGHKANMLNTRWTHVGVGTYQDDSGLTWGVQVFGDYGTPSAIPNPGDAVIDLDDLSYSGTVQCVVLVREPSKSEFFRQCGTRSGNRYVFSDVPPGTYSAKLLSSGGATLYAGWPSGAGTFQVEAKAPPGLPSRVSGAVSTSNVTGTSVDVSWSAPANGGSPIVEYVVRRSDDGGKTWNPNYTQVLGNPAATSVRVSGLTPGKTYVFQVAVRNSVGWAGVWSDSSAPVKTVQAGLPSRVSGAVSTSNVTGTSVDVSWSAPANGGSTIVEYVVRRSDDGGKTWNPNYTQVLGNPAGTSTKVTGLTPGKTYLFQVAVRNAVGWAGVWSDSSAPVKTAP